MQVLLSVISCSQVETIGQIFALVGVEPYATFKVGKTEVAFDNPPPPGRPSLANAPPWARKCKKMPHKCPGGGGISRLGTDQAITNTLQKLTVIEICLNLLQYMVIMSTRSQFYHYYKQNEKTISRSLGGWKERIL